MQSGTGETTDEGARLGVLMLETRFPRVPGDIGNPLTWPFPVAYRVVPGASADHVVRRDPMTLLPEFVAAAEELVAEGCDGLMTTCGFLALMQDELSTAVPVPVATSSLLQVPVVGRTLPAGRRVGVITISAEALTPAHFRAAGVEDAGAVPVVGTTPDGAFASGILGDRETLDFEACHAEMMASADALMALGDIGAIVLECTNMVPYAADIRRRTGRPVFSVYSPGLQFHAGLVPRRFAEGGR